MGDVREGEQVLVNGVLIAVPQGHGRSRLLGRLNGGNEVAVSRDHDGVLDVARGRMAHDVNGKKDVHPFLFEIFTVAVPAALQFSQTNAPARQADDLTHEGLVLIHPPLFAVGGFSGHPGRAVVEIAAQQVQGDGFSQWL